MDNLYANKQTLHYGQQQIMIHWDELGRAEVLLNLRQVPISWSGHQISNFIDSGGTK